MKVKTIVDERFEDYKDLSMFVCSNTCDWKCCREAHIPVSICQNSGIAQKEAVEVTPQEMFDRYISNPFSKALVFGGLEPMLQFNEMVDVIKYFRNHDCDDTIVIYTGYYKDEIADKITILQDYKNIIVKFGRYKPNSEKRFDEVLGVELISSNQYAEKIS